MRKTAWFETKDGNVPTFKWILVRNSTGFMAAVNEVVYSPETETFYGYVLTPEEERNVISHITHWANIPK